MSGKEDQGKKLRPRGPNLRDIMGKMVDSFGMPGLKEWIKHIEDPLDYADPDDRREVLEKNIQLFRSKMRGLQGASNISPESSEQFMQNRSNFDSQEWDALQEIQNEIAEYEECVRLEQQAEEFKEIVEDHEKRSSTQGEAQEKPKRKIPSYRGWIPS